jgi:AraC-like DNA-binding protein
VSERSVRDVELAALIAEQERDDLYGDRITSARREVSLDAPLSADANAGSWADLVGEDDEQIAQLLGEDETEIRAVRDATVTAQDVASWRWARSRRKWTYKQIAEHFGVSASTVQYRLSKPTRRESERRARLEARFEFAKAAYENGAFLMDIAAELHREVGYATRESCRQALYHLFADRRVKMRPRSWKHGMRSCTATPEQVREYQRQQSLKWRQRHRANPPTRCAETTQTGRRCRCWALEGSDLCRVHALPHPMQKWTRENVIDAMRLWAKRNGRYPTPREWVRASDDHPTFKTVYDLFDSWPAALEVAA